MTGESLTDVFAVVVAGSTAVACVGWLAVLWQTRRRLPRRDAPVDGPWTTPEAKL